MVKVISMVVAEQFLMFLQFSGGRKQPWFWMLIPLFFCFNKLEAAAPPLPLSTITLTNIDTEGCCFQLNYNYDGALGDIDALETRILTPNVLFSSVQFSLGNGWSYDELFAQRRLRWWHESGSIPLEQQVLADFCFSGWNTSTPIELLVIWRQGNLIRQRDTIRVACTQCWQAQNPIVNCEPDSTYSYTFDYVNLSEFPVDYLQLREENDQDLIIEQTITLDQSLLPGEIATGITLNFRQEAGSFEEICFEITARYFRNDSIVVECCTAAYCTPIPLCDRCCTDYPIFEAEVRQGFSITVNCEDMSVRMQANALNECDRVRFDIAGLGAGIVSGNEAIVFGNLTEDQSYEVSMNVIRRNMNGEDCYEEMSLAILDTFIFDCIMVATTEAAFIEGGKLWPNPADQRLNIEAPVAGRHFFELWNAMGQRLLQAQTNDQGKAQILTSQWPTGLYYVKVYINEQTLWCQAFMIDH